MAEHSEETLKLLERRLADRVTERPGIQQEYPKIAAQAQNVAESTQQARQQVEAVAARPTVWFQFAGAPRPQAQDFSRALVKKGYIVPGEDREPGAAGKRGKVPLFLS